MRVLRGKERVFANDTCHCALFFSFTEVDSQTVLARADCKAEWRIRRAAP
jgi:hypothetical protein